MPENRLHFTTIGSSENPSILFLHGFLGAGKDWHSIGERISNSYFVILPDLPGHAGSSFLPESQCTFDSTILKLNNLLLRLNARDVTLVGYSMGARIALYMAMEYQDRLNSVVLEGCNPGIRSDDTRGARNEWEQRIIDRLNLLSISEFVDEWYNMPLFRSIRSNRVLFEALRENRIQDQNVDGLIASIKGVGLGCQPNLWSRLGKINPPVLLLAGELDEKFRAISEEMSRDLAKAQFEVIGNAGHMAHYEREKEFIDVLSGFLNRVSRD